MIWMIAWRNVWRNKKRSGIIICAIAFGLWAGLMTMALSLGWADQVVNSAIATRLSHFQIHRQGFLAHKEIGLTIPDGNEVLHQVRRMHGIKAAVGRSVVAGMASSAATGTGVEIYGIFPEEEKAVTDLHNQIIAGNYFDSARKNPAIIGEKLAKKLELEVGNKIILTAQMADGNLGAGAFRVVGIYKTVSSMFDETAIFARHDDLNRIFDLQNGIHEIALLVDDSQRMDEFAAELEKTFPSLAINTWKDLAPELGMTTEMTDQMLYIFLVIILLALVFGITNTMLMGVLERIRELGVIIALGMKGARIFLMIVLETIFLSLMGGLFGILIGAVTIQILMHTGIDLSIFAEGLAAFGTSEILYPVLPFSEYPKIVALVMATALVAAIYPGIKAVRLNPSQAIRTY